MGWFKRLWRKVFRRRRSSGAGSAAKMTETMAMWMRHAYENAEISDRFLVEIQRVLASYHANLGRYSEVARDSGVPVEVIVAIHYMECDLDFNKALHNGQTLTHVNRHGTTWAPEGYGKGKRWMFEDAAKHALKLKRSIFPDTWDVANTLNFLEQYNGLGYRLYHKSVNTPYLWSGTQHYSRGKYKSDGKWSDRKVSGQVGCVPLLRELGFDGEEKI